jgi:hypothetical protein
MPQHKGFEPFTRMWTVKWKTINQSGLIPAGTLIARPRIRIFGSQAEADAFYSGLIAASAPTVGHPAPGTISAPFEENFFNKKSFITVFVNEKTDELIISS